MNLESHCASYFDSGVRQRGTRYYRDDAVQILGLTHKSVVATVMGTEEYFVRLEVERSKTRRHKLYVECSCPYFEGGSPCKHIWALIKVADTKRWAEDVARSGSISVFCADIDEDFSDDWLAEDEDEAQLKDSEIDFEAQPKKNMPQTKAALHLKIVTADKLVPALDWKKVFTPPKPADLRNVYLSSEVYNHQPRQREIRYALNQASSQATGTLTIDLFQREERLNGGWGVTKALKIDQNDLASISDAHDQRILALLLGSRQQHEQFNGYYSFQLPKVGSFRINPVLLPLLLPELAKTGRLYRLEPGQERPSDDLIHIDTGEPAAVALALVPHPDDKSDWLLKAELKRKDETFSALPVSLISPTLAVAGDRLLAMQPVPVAQHTWISTLLAQTGVKIAAAELDHFLDVLMRMPNAPRLSLASECGWRQACAEPAPRLVVVAPAHGSSRPSLLGARIFFDYAGEKLRMHDPRSTWSAPESKTLWQRHTEAETQLLSPLLSRQDIVQVPFETGRDVDVGLPATALAALTEELTAAGWMVEAEGRLLRHASQFKAFVASGVDWFDLQASCQFGDIKVDLPALLKALQTGDPLIRLDDGSVGLLPGEWLKKFADMQPMAAANRALLRFTRPQAALLDALLEGLPEVTVDSRFQAMRDRLKSFAGVTPQDPSPGFKGNLRDYQRDGLGWLQFLADFGFGGCLADDMGLGKTIQVLAMLQDRKAKLLGNNKPSLIVLPRSLVHNWRNEAARFTPDLRILDLTTSTRRDKWNEITQHDVILSTYGLVRTDIDLLRAISFDYCILDEAQAIKNDSSQSAKAARLLQADHRLAMSGTPVENHLGELGSIFSFLNPGMLTPSLLSRLSSKKPDEIQASSQLLAKALRPFILRRTKEQVLKDLPEKTEQTIFCDLAPEQRKLYNELRQHYRSRLTKSIAAKGMGKSQIDVLEALLRLRQAACHPGLIDKAAANKPSAKLSALMDQLVDVVAGGHKALIFSQFTTMLGLVKKRLDEEGIVYEYLDGRTKNREAKVGRFQNDDSVQVFLISLKAGGVGLNLTAADYCFILDPWWNPAVEAQAIDRAHRMGQTKRVFAYRLIATDTVEEKIMELQEKKRGLADAIVSAENAQVRGLTLDDVELLLS